MGILWLLYIELCLVALVFQHVPWVSRGVKSAVKRVYWPRWPKTSSLLRRIGRLGWPGQLEVSNIIVFHDDIGEFVALFGWIPVGQLSHSFLNKVRQNLTFCKIV